MSEQLTATFFAIRLNILFPAFGAIMDNRRGPGLSRDKSVCVCVCVQ